MVDKESRPHMINSSENLRESGRDIRSWGCDVCGYVYRGATTPSACPNCNSAADHFRRVSG